MGEENHNKIQKKGFPRQNKSIQTSFGSWRQANKLSLLGRCSRGFLWNTGYRIQCQETNVFLILYASHLVGMASAPSVLKEFWDFTRGDRLRWELVNKVGDISRVKESKRISTSYVLPQKQCKEKQSGNWNDWSVIPSSNGFCFL